MGKGGQNRIDWKDSPPGMTGIAAPPPATMSDVGLDSFGSEDEFQPQVPDASHSDAHTTGHGHEIPTYKSKSANEEDGSESTACQSCRKKKTKCSRERPCSNCIQLDVDCVYLGRRMKPGMRKGAVENLNQRLVELENMFLGQGILWEQVWGSLRDIREDLRMVKSAPLSRSPEKSHESLQLCTSNFRNALSNPEARKHSLVQQNDEVQAGQKRQRSNDIGHSQPDQSSVASPLSEPSEDIRYLPPDYVMDELINLYFANVQPWIPVLHERRFRERMAHAEQRKSLKTIFHAIVAVCVRFSANPLFSKPGSGAKFMQRSKHMVIFNSMESFSVENLQALVIIAFDTIGSGRGPSAWSIVGSMARTVEQLQLSVEEEEEEEDEKQVNPVEFLIHKMAFLTPPSDWIEREERRRVFWNVFLLDRFCSIATGWDLSLPSANIRRRLPCHGPLWQKCNPLKKPTPYFGVADQRTYETLTQAVPPDRDANKDEQPIIAGFAYRIEATESLSLVTRFFLKHPVNVDNVRDVQIWMMKFKELDLRLIHWKIMLPEKWREARVFNDNGVMDENLSLAHVTHNTAVIMLHQCIACPSPQWQNSPWCRASGSSIETCFAAASEISVIAEKFLLSSTAVLPPQFAFCLFIAARMLLAHTRRHKSNLPPEFNILTNSLLEISRRWNGQSERSSKDSGNLASKFAARLIQARDLGPAAAAHQPSLDLRQVVYSENEAASGGQPSETQPSQEPTRPQMSSSFSLSVDHSATPNYLSGWNQISETNHIRNGHSMVGARTHETFRLPAEVSLAFPPLPESFLADEFPTARSNNPQRDLNVLFPTSGQSAGSPGNMADGVYQDFEDLSSFPGNEFQTMQRISTFAGAGNWGFKDNQGLGSQDE